MDIKIMDVQKVELTWLWQRYGSQYRFTYH